MVKVSWVVDVELITDWLAGLDDRSHELVIAALELLAEGDRCSDGPSSTPSPARDTTT